MPRSSRSVGGKWTYCLEFYNYDEQPNPKILRLKKSDLTTYEEFLNSEQQIVEIYRLIHPLHWSQLSWNHMHHAFIVMRTAQDEVWSFEKNQEGLVVQREFYAYEYCVKYLHGNRRTWFYTVQEKAKCVYSGVTVQDVLKWILKNDELNKSYDLLSDNCQHFADRITHAIGTVSTVDQLWYDAKNYTGRTVLF
jgi:hypothetical protein